MTEPENAVGFVANPALAEKVSFTPTALVFKQPLTFDEWLEIGTRLSKMLQSIHWYIGDWLVEGDFRYGEKYAQAVDATGFSVEICKRDFWVARRFPRETRHAELSYSHHIVVSSLPERARHRLIQEASSRVMTTRELKTAAAVYRAAENGEFGEVQGEVQEEVGRAVESDPAVVDVLLAAEPPEPPKPREWVYRAWYVQKLRDDDTNRCERCGETGAVGEVHLVRLERESIPTPEEIAATEEEIARLNSTDPPAGLEPGEKYDYPPPTAHESRVVCAKCLWSLTS